jgi:tetratricopeptide (TPR) repeat protein
LETTHLSYPKNKQTASSQMNLTMRIASKRSKRAKVIGGGIILLLLAFSLWVQNGRSTVQAAHEFYLSGDCENAMLQYDKVFSLHSFLGEFDFDLYQETWECAIFLAAGLMEDEGPEVAIQSYEAFVATYEDSPLTIPALASIHRLYVDWAEAERERGAYQPAITILEKATAAYPALEAETEERLLQTYLAWGDAVQSAGHTDAAISIYNELQSRYPQFTAEAQSAINSVETNPAN